MSRKSLFIRGVGIGYIALAVNIAYSLVSIPLALAYLGKEQFGLWAVVLQIVGFLHLLDFGISNGISRIVIDEKDNRTSGAYGSVLLTGTIAQTIIGLCVIFAGWLIGPWAAVWFRIPHELSTDFIRLIGYQATIAGLGIAFRLVGSLLFAFQRNDLVGLQTIGLFVIYLLTLWTGLHMGFGLYSMVLSMGCGLIWTVFVYTFLNIKLGLFPHNKSEWGHPSWLRFRSIFSYSKDLFLMTIGSQVLSGAPILVVSRIFGLDAAAAWSICSKPFQIISQIVNKPYDLSFPALSEMFVRNEIHLLRNRVKEIFQFTSTLSAIAFAYVATLSPLFIEIWTNGKIQWAIENYIALATMYYIFSIFRIPNGFVGVSKKIRLIKYAYFADGAFFLAISLLLKENLTVWVIPIIATATHALLSTPIGLKYFYQDCNVRPSDFFNWLYPSLICAFILGSFVYYAVSFFSFNGAITNYGTAAITILLLACLGVLLLWRFGVTKSMRESVWSFSLSYLNFWRS